MPTNDELISITLKSLYLTRDTLKKQLVETEKAINYQQSQLSSNTTPTKIKSELTTPTLFTSRAIPPIGNLKIVIKGLFDDYGQPIKMNDLQDLYKTATGKDYNIRETVRGLNKKGELKIMKINNSNRNACWVKSEWVKDGKLLDQFKWEDFDNMYIPEDIKFV